MAHPEDPSRLVAVPTKIALEALRRSKRAETTPTDKFNGVAIPFQSIHTPADAQAYARLILAQQRGMGYDFRDTVTASEAAGEAESALRRSQQQMSVHLTTNSSKKLNLKTDLGMSSVDYWSSLNQEFKELSSHPAGRVDTSSGFYPQSSNPFASQQYRSYPSYPPQPPTYQPPAYPQPPPHYQPPPPSRITCSYCRTPSVEGGRFCFHCGAPLTTTSASYKGKEHPKADRAPTPVHTPAPPVPEQPPTPVSVPSQRSVSRHSHQPSELEVVQPPSVPRSVPPSIPPSVSPSAPPSERSPLEEPLSQPPSVEKPPRPSEPYPGEADPTYETASPGSPASKRNTAVALDNDEVALTISNPPSNRPMPDSPAALPAEPEPAPAPAPVPEPVPEPAPQPDTPKQKPKEYTAMAPVDRQNEAASPGSPASKKNTAVALDNDEIDLDNL